MKIAILDQENNRAIVCEVPEYLTAIDRSTDDLGVAILTALGLSLSNCEYMIGEFDIAIDVGSLNSGRGYGNNTRRLDEFTNNFQEDVLAALEESK